MAWNTVTDVNDGQSFGGAAWQTAINAIEQIQDALGPDESRVPQLIETLTGNGTTVTTFSAIPATFRHLRLVGRPLHNNASAADTNRVLAIRFNGDSGGNYNWLQVLDTTASTTRSNADSATSPSIGLIGDNLISSIDIVIPSYQQSVHTAQAVGVASSSGNPSANWAMFRNTVFHADSAAITSLSLIIVSGGGDVFAAGSQLSLYGLP